MCKIITNDSRSQNKTWLVTLFERKIVKNKNKRNSVA